MRKSWSMRIDRRSCLAGALAMPLLAGARAPDESPLQLEVLSIPEAVPCGGRIVATYELRLWNIGGDAIRLDRVLVRAPGGGELFVAERVALAERMSVPGVLADGQIATLYLEVSLPSPAPAGLMHVIGYRLAVAATTATLAVPLDTTPVPVLAAPLRGGPWVAIHAPEWERGHRRVIYDIGGRARIPGRLAIDFVRVDADGRAARDDADVPANALGYGSEVLAVADARVAAARDGMAESPSVSRNPKHARDDAAGNFISLDLGGGRFAIYEHLKPGSIKVKPGDRVRSGQAIAALGFTGDTTGPHLHFHVADAPMPLLGEGKGFVFAGYEQLGGYADLGALGSKAWAATSNDGARVKERPASNTVLRF
jgi:murein DD-endopeptidase